MSATPLYSLAGKRVWVAGHRGMVGGALVRRLASEDCEVLTVPRQTLDLTDATGSPVTLASAAATQDAGIFSTSHDVTQSAINQFDGLTITSH